MRISGRTLVSLREGKGWSQTKAAEVYGISRPFLARIESGDRQPSPKVAQRIGEAHGLGLGDILDVSESIAP